MTDSFKWAIVYNFAYRLCSAFDGIPKVKTDPDNYRIIVSGKLILASNEMQTKAKAQCDILIDEQWAEKQPAVICKEPWVTLGKSDWHISAEGQLCWDYHLRWKDCIKNALDKRTLGEASEIGTIWILRSTRNLLNRHLFAYREGIKEWRKEWDYWAHDQAADAEYLKSLPQVQE